MDASDQTQEHLRDLQLLERGDAVVFHRRRLVVDAPRVRHVDAAADRTKTNHGRHLMTLALSLILASSLATQAERFDAFEKTIPELQDAMERGDVTSVELVCQYLARIEAFDRRGPKLNAMIYVNPRALDDAAALDQRAERARFERTASRHSHHPQGQLRHVRHADDGRLDRPRRTCARRRWVPGQKAPRGRRRVHRQGQHARARLRHHHRKLAFSGQTRNPYDPARNPGGSSGERALPSHPDSRRMWTPSCTRPFVRSRRGLATRSAEARALSPRTQAFQRSAFQPDSPTTVSQSGSSFSASPSARSSSSRWRSRTSRRRRRVELRRAPHHSSAIHCRKSFAWHTTRFGATPTRPADADASLRAHPHRRAR